MAGSNPGRGASSASSSSSPSPARPPRDGSPLLSDGRPLPSRTQSALLFPPAPPPLHVTIRFSASVPDLHLDVPSPQQTTVVALKHLIRGRLAADVGAEAGSKHDADTPKRQPSPAAQAAVARLRFIHNGRILPDTSVLGAVLKAPPPPPVSHPDPKGKSPHHRHPQQRVFINCSIGDPLSSPELQEEATLAVAPPPPPSPSPSLSHSELAPSKPPTPHLTITTTTTAATTAAADSQQPAPPLAARGFDRLIQAGLTASEVSTLRSHFRAIHTARFAPDSMPSPDTLRSMEDAWLDSQGHLPTTASPAYGAAGGAGAGTGDVDGDGSGMVGMEEDAFGLSAVAGPLIRGMLIGFVFPLGVLGWVGKEDGVWSRRMQVFVAFGVLLSLSVGVVRELTGEA